MPKYTYTDAEGIAKLEPGEYTFTIQNCEEGISKNGGNAMIKYECIEVNSGAKVYDQIVFTERAAWKIDMLLKSIGYALQKGQDVELLPEHLEGKRFRAVVTMEAGQDGKEYARIGTIIAKKDRTLKLETVQPKAATSMAADSGDVAW